MKKMILLLFIAGMASAAAAQPPRTGYNTPDVRKNNNEGKKLSVNTGTVEPSNIDSRLADLSATRGLYDYERNLAVNTGTAEPSNIDGRLADLSATRGLNDYDKNEPATEETKDAIPSINEYNFEGNVIVANPVSDMIFIKSPDQLNITKVEVYDLQGRLQLVQATSGNSLEIGAYNLKTGIYYIRIYFGKASISKQVYKA